MFVEVLFLDIGVVLDYVECVFYVFDRCFMLIFSVVFGVFRLDFDWVENRLLFIVLYRIILYVL